MIVMDASACVPALIDTGPKGEAARARMRGVRATAIPHLLDVEVASALLGLARGTRGGEPKLDGAALDVALDDYRRMPLLRHPALPLWPRMRQLAANLSVHDATYVALAEGLDVPLVTCDGRIARAGVARCPVDVLT